MKKINKTAEPDFFTDFIKRNNPGKWNDIAPIKKKLREYIIEEQEGCCAYTERRFNKPGESHIDHHRGRAHFPKLIFTYSNLLAAYTCRDYGAYTKEFIIKSEQDYEHLINPVEEEPSDFLYFTTMGTVLSRSDNPKGEKTIEAFQLNHPSLIKHRKDHIHNLLAIKESLTEDEVVNYIGEFESMLRQLYKDLKD